MKAKGKVTVPSLLAMKAEGKKIAALTAYDTTFAALEDAAGVDLILVGDSAGMVMQGSDDTIEITLEDILVYTRNARRGVKRALLAADLPFGIAHESADATIRGCVRLMKEGGAEAVKVEGAGPVLEPISRMTQMGIPVIGHLGLTPQSVHSFGGYGMRGGDEAEAERIRRDALALQEAGVFAIVLEKIPKDLAAEITKSLHIPTIGIGSGPECDGQILVCYDMLGLGPKFRFVRRYIEGADLVKGAVQKYVDDIRGRDFPSESESYNA